jgi:hypothetical protein
MSSGFLVSREAAIKIAALTVHALTVGSVDHNQLWRWSCSAENFPDRLSTSSSYPTFCPSTSEGMPALDCADVDEDVFSTRLRLDKTKASVGI